MKKLIAFCVPDCGESETQITKLRDIKLYSVLVKGRITCKTPQRRRL